jgi:hypothetical protein
VNLWQHSRRNVRTDPVMLLLMHLRSVLWAIIGIYLCGNSLNHSEENWAVNSWSLPFGADPDGRSCR